MTSKELVYRTLEFNDPVRAPRQMWTLPWANINYPEEVKEIENRFPTDFDGPPGYHTKLASSTGDPYEIGEYIDEWGCIFENKARGIIGEVKKPIVLDSDENWDDTSRIHIPEEWLSIDKDKINQYCSKSDKFLMAGCCPRPFERLQFIRGTEMLYIDLMMKPKKMFEFIEKMHDFYCRLLTEWAQTDVDALGIMDDWGSQNSLLINPKLWVEIFKPMYKDYINIAHKYGKKMFMHSDGYILDIYPHLIELGLDAINSQVFCMGIDKLQEYSGFITFWGEMDRQYLLSRGTKQEVMDAVKEFKNKLWRNGGCIAQLEFGAGAKPENIYATYKEWEEQFK